MINKPEQIKEAFAGLIKICEEVADFKNGVEYQGVDEGECVAGIYIVAAKDPLAALEACEARLDSSELEEERSFYITYQYTASDDIITASAAVHKVQGVLTCEVITSWADQLNKEQGYENCNIIFYKELEKQPLKQ